MSEQDMSDQDRIAALEREIAVLRYTIFKTLDFTIEMSSGIGGPTSEARLQHIDRSKVLLREIYRLTSGDRKIGEGSLEGEANE